jgi:hypothetical protein
VVSWTVRQFDRQRAWLTASALVISAAARCRTGSRTIGKGRYVLESENTTNSFHVVEIGRYQNSSDLATRVRQKDVESEAARHVGQSQSVLRTVALQG